MEIPMWYVYGALPIGFLCIIFRLLQVLFHLIRTFGKEEEG